MTVQELIDYLMRVKDKNIPVFVVQRDEDSGCSTCGYGARVDSLEPEIHDLETRVEITGSY